MLSLLGMNFQRLSGRMPSSRISLNQSCRRFYAHAEHGAQRYECAGRARGRTRASAVGERSGRGVRLRAVRILERGTAAASRRRPALPQARAREATAARRQRMRAHSKRLRRCFHCHCRLFHRSGDTEHTRTFFATVLALPPGGFISSPSVHVEYGWLMVALGPRTQCARSDERGNGEEGRRVGRAVWRREEWMGGGGGGGAGGGREGERGRRSAVPRRRLVSPWGDQRHQNARASHFRHIIRIRVPSVRALSRSSVK